MAELQLASCIIACFKGFLYICNNHQCDLNNLHFAKRTKAGEFLQNNCNGASFEMFCCKEKEVFDRNYKLEAASILFCNYAAFPIHSVLSKLNAKAVIVKMSQKTFVISFIRIRWKRSLFGDPWVAQESPSSLPRRSVGAFLSGFPLSQVYSHRLEIAAAFYGFCLQTNN